jgi:hypothetical protein
MNTVKNSGEYLDIREGKQQEAGENCIMRSCIICTLHQGHQMTKGGGM